MFAAPFAAASVQARLAISARIGLDYPLMTVPEAFAHAQQRHATGDFANAETLYRQILAVVPQHADALHFLGVLLSQTGRSAEGLECVRQSVALNPLNSAYLDNLGTIYRDLRRFAEAADCARRALQLQPHVAETHNNLANALRDLGQLPEALWQYERALQLAPGYAQAAQNYSVALRLAGRLTEALHAAQRAATLAPNASAAHTTLGGAQADLGLIDPAHESHRAALQADPADPEARSAYLLHLHYLPSLTADQIAQEHRTWGNLAPPPDVRPVPGVATRFAEHPLRVGFVSPDFREHPVSHFLRGWLPHLESERVTTFCYCDTKQPDAITASLEAALPRWRRTAQLGDAELSQQIRADEIDILIDLAGHTADHRLGIFAQRVAPVQASYLGYCDTTGIAEMDFRITDAIADPPGVSDQRHTEKLVRLPGCFTCYAPPVDAPPPGASPAKQRGFVTYASFHVLSKVNAQLLDSWAEILRRVPHSRLLLMSLGIGEPEVRRRIVDFFAQRGIAASRLDLRPRAALPAYLDAHHEADILLDSYPFSGHTVSCHALWMGLPVITRAGDRHAARMVASVLTTLAHHDWIADSAERYIELAAKLGSDIAQLAQHRRDLRERVARTPLTDGRSFAHNFETALLKMWKSRISSPS